jgi:hypothetical protein
VTVAVTGTTVIFESTRAGKSKLIVLEGGARASLVKHSGQSQYVRAGQMLDVPAGATTLPLPTNIDLNQVMNSHPLITDFPPLPSRDLILAASQQPPPAGPPPRGPSTFPILPVIDVLSGGLNRRPHGPRRNPPGDHPQPSPPRGPVTGRGPGAGPNKVTPTQPTGYTNQPPGHTKVAPVTTHTQNVPRPSPTPKKRAVKKTNQSNQPSGPR